MKDHLADKAREQNVESAAAAVEEKTTPTVPEVTPDWKSIGDPEREVSLTNKDGKEITCRILSMEGEMVALSVKGQPYTVAMAKLSQRSQRTVRDVITARMMTK